jgi:hypothetical protein
MCLPGNRWPVVALVLLGSPLQTTGQLVPRATAAAGVGSSQGCCGPVGLVCNSTAFTGVMEEQLFFAHPQVPLLSPGDLEVAPRTRVRGATSCRSCR